MSIYPPLISTMKPAVNSNVKTSTSPNTEFSFVVNGDRLQLVILRMYYKQVYSGQTAGGPIDSKTFFYNEPLKNGEVFSEKYFFDSSKLDYTKYGDIYYYYELVGSAATGVSGAAGEQTLFVTLDDHSLSNYNFDIGQRVRVVSSSSSSDVEEFYGYIGRLYDKKVSVFGTKYGALTNNLDDAHSFRPNFNVNIRDYVESAAIPVYVSSGYSYLAIQDLEFSEGAFVSHNATFKLNAKLMGGNAPNISKYRLKFYDKAIATVEPEPLYTTDWIYSSNISYNIENILNNTNLYIAIEAYDTNGKLVTTPKEQVSQEEYKFAETISVQYYFDPKIANLNPTITEFCQESRVNINWDSMRLLYGGTYPLDPVTHNYTGYLSVNDFIEAGNQAIQIDKGYDLQFPRNDDYHTKYYFTKTEGMGCPMFLWAPNINSWRGKVITINYDDGIGEISVEIINNKIYRRFGSQLIYDGILNTSSNIIYLVGITPTRAIFREWITFTPSSYEHNELDVVFEDGSNVL